MLTFFRASPAAGELRPPSRVDDLMDHIPDALLAVDGDGVITRGNVAASRLFGREDRPIVGMLLRALVVRADREVLDDQLGRARVARTVPFDIRVKVLGRTTILSLAAAPLGGKPGRDGVAISARDSF